MPDNQSTARRIDLACQLVWRWPGLRREHKEAYCWLAAQGGVGVPRIFAGSISQVDRRLADAWDCEVPSVRRRLDGLEKARLAVIVRTKGFTRIYLVLPVQCDERRARPLGPVGRTEPQRSLAFEDQPPVGLRLVGAEGTPTLDGEAFPSALPCEGQDLESSPSTGVPTETVTDARNRNRLRLERATVTGYGCEDAKRTSLRTRAPARAAQGPVALDQDQVLVQVPLIEDLVLEWDGADREFRELVVEQANGVRQAIWPNRLAPLDDRDRSLLAKAALLAQAVLGDDWLAEAVAASASKRHPPSFLHMALAGGAWDRMGGQPTNRDLAEPRERDMVRRWFGQLLRRVTIPGWLAKPKPR